MSTAAPALSPSPTKTPPFWARLFRISFTELFLLAFIGWSFAAAPDGWMRPLTDGDTGLHIRLGDFMLANHTVPTVDMFSYSKPGQEWYAFEWLSEIVLSVVNGQFGLKGISFGAAVLIALFETLLLLFTLSRGVNAILALGLVLISANATSIHYSARPHLFTLLFLTVTLWMVAKDREQQNWHIWLLIPLTILWTNLHGGFFILFPLLLLLALGSGLERQWQPAKRYGILAAGCMLASVVNPYGLKLHQHIIETLSAKWLIELVDEFKSPQFRSEPLLCFMVVLFLGLGVAAILLEKGRYVEPLWIAFFAYSALISVRHTTLFVLVAVPIVGVELTQRWQRWLLSQQPKSVARILDDISKSLAPKFGPIGIMTLAGIAAYWYLTPAESWPKNFPKELFPVSIQARYGSQLAASRLLTTDQWGGFLIYNEYPRQKVFIDGRHNYYGQQIVKPYMALLSGKPTWHALIKEYNFDMILMPSDAPLVSLLRTDPEWRQLAEGDGGTLFTRVPHAG